MTGPALALYVLVFACLFGLVIGSFLNVVIYRVPAGIPLTRESRCPACEAPVRPWQNVPLVSWISLRGRCASCGARISVRYPAVELGTAAFFVAVAWLVLHTAAEDPTATIAVIPVLIAYLYFAAISVALTLIDLDVHRLPNAIVLPAYAVLTGLFTMSCLLGADWSGLLRAAIGGAALFFFYLVLRLVRPDGMGGGDVKLAGVVGIALGWLGWGPLVVGAFAAFLLGGVFGLVLLAMRRARRKTAIPFGPWMIAGAWVGIVAGDAVARWYVGLFFAG